MQAPLSQCVLTLGTLLSYICLVMTNPASCPGDSKNTLQMWPPSRSIEACGGSVLWRSLSFKERFCAQADRQIDRQTDTHTHTCTHTDPHTDSPHACACTHTHKCTPPHTQHTDPPTRADTQRPPHRPPHAHAHTDPPTQCTQTPLSTSSQAWLPLTPPISSLPQHTSDSAALRSGKGNLGD